MSRELIPLDQSPPQSELTNFVGDGWDRILFLSKVTQEECVPSDESLGHEINVVYYHMRCLTKADEETGEMKPFIRTVLLDADGTAYEFGSDGIVESMRMIFGSFPIGRLDPPVTVVPRSARTKRGRTRYFLEPIRKEEPKAATQT